MQGSRKRLLVALALITGGILAFFAFLAVMGIDPDERPLRLSDWIVAGMLIGPGFGYLIQWRRMKDHPSNGRASDDLS